MPTLAPPISYAIGTPPNTTSIGTIRPAVASPSRPGTAQKKSRQVTAPEVASKYVTKPPPPMPVRMLSETQAASTAAAAASAAEPPAWRTRRPTSAVAGWPAATPAGTPLTSSRLRARVRVG
jgi:hypothetical protein